MNKEIEKAKLKLDELRKERERKEVRYNSHAIIIEGHRESLKVLEDRSKSLIDELSEANNNVGKQESILKELIEKYQKEENERENNM